MNIYSVTVDFGFTAAAFFVIFAVDKSQALDLLREEIKEHGDRWDSFMPPDADNLGDAHIKLADHKAEVLEPFVIYVGWAGD